MKISSILLIIFFVVILLAVVIRRYEQYMISGNFFLELSTSCDPTIENCFVSDCSPEEDLECDSSPYKRVEILKSDAPSCLEEHTCDSFSCSGIENCSITLCSEDELEDGEKCLSTFNNDNLE